MAQLAKEQDGGQFASTDYHVSDVPGTGLALPARNSDSSTNRRHQRGRPRSEPSLQRSSASLGRRQISEELSRTTSEAVTVDAGKRRTVAQAFAKASKILGMAAREWTDDTGFQRGRAQDWPEIPGEPNRNRHLSQIRTQYNRPRDQSGNITPAGHGRSRASSFIGSDLGRDNENSPARSSGEMTSLFVATSRPRDTISPTRAPTSAPVIGDENHVELREFSRSREHHGYRLDSPNLLEVPRPAFLETRDAFVEHTHEPD
jgi:hypothetical protein